MNLKDRIRARMENCYTQGIAICRNDECLGEEIKMRLGTFNRGSLDCHRRAAEQFGMHRAFAEVLNMMVER